MEDTIAIFASRLERYETEEITKAFLMWMDEGEKMPVPKNIITIIARNRPPKPYKPPEGRKHFPTQEEISNVEDMMKTIRAQHAEANLISLKNGMKNER